MVILTGRCQYMVIENGRCPCMGSLYGSTV